MNCKIMIKENNANILFSEHAGFLNFEYFTYLRTSVFVDTEVLFRYRKPARRK